MRRQTCDLGDLVWIVCHSGERTKRDSTVSGTIQYAFLYSLQISFKCFFKVKNQKPYSEGLGTMCLNWYYTTVVFFVATCMSFEVSNGRFELKIEKSGSRISPDFSGTFFFFGRPG